MVMVFEHCEATPFKVVIRLMVNVPGVSLEKKYHQARIAVSIGFSSILMEAVWATKTRNLEARIPSG